ncbi:hypothetical protein ACFQ9X_51505 [Catenulispora yoronensis]
MRTLAQGPLATVNDWLNQNVVPAEVLAGALLAAGGAAWATVVKRRRLSWSVVYDAPINIDDKDMWSVRPKRASQDLDAPQLVILEIRNTGLLDVRKGMDWDSLLKFTFSGMDVVDLKVRGTPPASIATTMPTGCGTRWRSSGGSIGAGPRGPGVLVPAARGSGVLVLVLLVPAALVLVVPGPAPRESVVQRPAPTRTPARASGRRGPGR